MAFASPTAIATFKQNMVYWSAISADESAAGPNVTEWASMWDGPFYRVRRDGYEICFVPGAGEDLAEVCNVDMWVIRDDGERWSGTMFTLDEVHRVMDRRRQAGDPEGDYWWCWDGLIVRDPGVLSMAKVIDGLVASGEHETVLRHVGPEEDI